MDRCGEFAFKLEVIIRAVESQIMNKSFLYVLLAQTFDMEFALLLSMWNKEGKEHQC